MENEIFTLPEFFTGNNAPEASIQFYSSSKPSFKNKIVFKQNLVCFLVQGTKEVHSLNSTLRLKDEQILLLQSGSVLMSEILTEQQKYESMLFFFSNKYLFDFCLKYHIILYDTSEHLQQYSLIDKDGFLDNFQASVKTLYNRLAYLHELKLEELLLYLFHSHTKQFVLFLRETNINTPENVIKKVVKNHIEDALTLEELAFLCNMSISTFKRHFVSVFKTSPQKYFITNKMVRAKHLLSLKSAPSEIYNELGYESLSSFSNEFKKYFGMSPRQFQQQNELKPQVFNRLA